MAVAQLNTTTLSSAITSGQTVIQVAATTNITAGQLLVVRMEAMKVQAVDDPSSGYCKVLRGVNGTEAKAHASGQRLFIGDHHAFKAIRDSATALVGDSGVFPDYMLPGQTAKDGAGNEYLLVDSTGTIYGGSTVVISVDGLYTAAVATAGQQGPIGLTVEQSSSAEYTWVQRFGYNAYAQDTVGAGGTSASVATVTATPSTPSVGLGYVAAATTVAAYLIHGMHLVGADTSTVTSATSATGNAIPVFLNYPYVNNYVEALDSSGS